MICPSCKKEELYWIRDMTSRCNACGREFVLEEGEWVE